MQEGRARRGEFAFRALVVACALLRLVPRLQQALIRRLVARTGLFDGAFYLQANPDVARAGWNALAHYVVIGDREGRAPMPMFDPAHYRAQAGGDAGRVSSLLHYAWIGRWREVSPHAWFDVGFYVADNPDVSFEQLDPLVHYATHGAFEGRSPCARFDGEHYLRANPDVARARENPLLHFLRYGLAEGRSALPEVLPEAAEAEEVVEVEEPLTLATPLLPGAGDWQAATPHPERPGAQVDVIVPVHQGRIETLRCLLGVLRAPCRTPFTLLVMTDASCDSALVAELRELAGRGLFTLLSSNERLGFVRSVNRALALHADRDVALLHADTEVSGDWLDRLRAAAAHTPRAGIVMPLSNNASTGSYPQAQSDNPYQLELSAAGLDQLAAEANAGIAVEAPAGAGFCLYLARACLAEVGLLDEKAAANEQDLCARAIRCGWRNLVAADVFVWHWSSASPTPDAADPLHAARQRLDRARLQRQSKDANVLVFCDRRGSADAQAMAAAGEGVFILRPAADDPAQAELSHPDVREVPNLPAIPLANVDALKQLCDQLRITELHVDSLAGFAPEAAGLVDELAQALGLCPEIEVPPPEGEGEPALVADPR